MTQKERLVDLFRNSPGVFVEGSEMEYAVADYLLANGVIMPPCKVGDTVYIIWSFGDKGYNIVADTIEFIDISKSYVSACTYKYGNFPHEQFGKIVFFTREEAEQALKERNKIPIS